MLLHQIVKFCGVPVEKLAALTEAVEKHRRLPRPSALRKLRDSQPYQAEIKDDENEIPEILKSCMGDRGLYVVEIKVPMIFTGNVSGQKGVFDTVQITVGRGVMSDIYAALDAFPENTLVEDVA